MRDISRDRPPRLRHELTQFNRCGCMRSGPARRSKLKGAHRAITHVREAIERRHFAGGDTPVRHISIDERVSEVVG